MNELPEGSRLLYKVLSGSHATNLVTPESDEDWRGVYQVPTHQLLGLQQPPETVELPPDTTYWELAHFARLCLKGNPNIMELLWIDPYYGQGTPENTYIDPNRKCDGRRCRQCRTDNARRGRLRQRVARMEML